MAICDGKKCPVSNMVQVATLYYNTDRLAPCEEQCGKILEVEPGCHWTRNTLGLIYLQTERCAKAIEIAGTVIGNGDSSDYSAYYVMASAHEFLGEYEEAVKICEKALALRTNSPGIWCTLVSTHTKAGNAEAALKTVKEILARFPNDPYALYCSFLAVNKFNRDTKEETRLCERLGDTGQKRELLYFCQGLIAEKEGQLDEAYRMFCRARAENMLELDLQKRVTAFEEKYPEIVQRAGK